MLAELESNAVQYFGKPLAHVEPVYELCGVFSRVLRLQVRTDDRALGVFVKRYERRTGTAEEELRFRRYVTREYERTSLARRCADAETGVVRPIACFPDEFALVTEAAKGAPLDHELTRLALLRTPSATRRLEQAFRRVGLWLRHFQATLPVAKTRLKDHRQYLDVRLQELVKAGQPTFTDADREAALAMYDAEATRLTPAPGPPA